MFANWAASSSTSSLSLDDLGWLAASALIDLPTLPSPRSSVVYALPIGTGRATWLSLRQYTTDDTEPVETTSPPSLDLSLSNALTPATPVKSRRFSPSTPHLPSPPLTPPHRVSPSPSPAPRSPVRTEWIYRQPRTPPRSHPQHASPTSSPSRPSSRPRSPTGYHSPPALTRSSSNSSMRSTGSIPNSRYVGRHRSQRSSASNTVPPPFWSTILRPRSRSERSIPSLKSIPSQSQIDFTPAPSTIISAALSSSTTSSSLSSASDPFKADSADIRPPSVASTVSTASLSTATSSSRPETPTFPAFVPSSYNNSVRPRYQRRRATDPSYGHPPAPLSASCPPSKSILTRASSISTKNSSSTAASKSVKFVDMPTVHYASTGYWDLHTSSNTYLERTETSLNMGLDVDSMDVDADSHLLENVDNSHPDECDRELQCSTPTPEKERAKGLRRLVMMSKKISAVSSAYSRPTISGPYALGALPNSPRHRCRRHCALLPHSSRSQASIARALVMARLQVSHCGQHHHWRAFAA
ncbi:hypothetical protein BDQ17DRAFT_1418500 [Cyathus striatus]|nr:hypothetical protein BDQ17DRAFT_1418500 [Cyathus striatus]